jgi:hypothetical protein
MLDRGNIIELAFLKLGEVGQIYSDNRTEQYEVTEKLLDDILQTVALDTDFLFNATTVSLTKNINSQNEFGQYRYNIPNDFLTIIRYSDNMKIEGEFIYSANESLNITYCRAIAIEEYPVYMKNYILLKLAVELCNTYSAYGDKLTLMHGYLSDEKIKIMNNEGLVISDLNGG